MNETGLGKEAIIYITSVCTLANLFISLFIKLFLNGTEKRINGRLDEINGKVLAGADWRAEHDKKYLKAIRELDAVKGANHVLTEKLKAHKDLCDERHDK